jgi:hypothetical protein
LIRSPTLDRPKAEFSSLAHGDGQVIKDGWKSVGKVFLIAMLLDVVYQILIQRFVYPGEVVLVAILLAIVPYLIASGLVTRMVTMFR